MLNLTRPSFSSDNALDLHAPSSWKELTQEQLIYLLKLLVRFNNPIRLRNFLGHRSTPYHAGFVVKTHLFARFTGLHVARRTEDGYLCWIRQNWFSRRSFLLQAWQVHDCLSQFEWVDKLEEMDGRLDAVGGLHAVNARLHGVTFGEYLNMEKYYQAFLMSENPDMLVKLALLLYRKKNGSMAKKIRMKDYESLGVFLWYGAIKENFSRSFRHFFKKVEGGIVEEFDFLASMNCQIRALTDGDVTKEDEILNIDCWRALTELNEKAREAADFKKKYGNK